MSDSAGQSLYRLAEELFPICRSITGDGLRATLRRISELVPLQIHEVPSGTRVLDWTVPKEWNIRDAWVKDLRGERVVDFQKCNLHVLNYSVPVRRRIGIAELREHLFTIPEHPDWIPYRTSYYAERWGFCVSQRQLEALTDSEYEVCIDSTQADGSLTYGEVLVPGETEEEVLVSCHVCHPSLANDNLSGMAVGIHAARLVRDWPERRYSYRFLFIPGTIGSITWLARNPGCIERVKHGLVLSCLGDSGACTYKKSRRGSARIDRAVLQVLRDSGGPYQVLEFAPYGYDERQYCSPGFNLPVGCFMRTPNGRYPEYHTSADNLSLLRPESLEDSLAKLLRIFRVLEEDDFYVNKFPSGEPQLGKRGLYSSLGGQADRKALEMAMLWVLNLSDGSASLLDIAERSGMTFEAIKAAVDRLATHGLLEKLTSRDSEDR